MGMYAALHYSVGGDKCSRWMLGMHICTVLVTTPMHCWFLAGSDAMQCILSLRLALPECCIQVAGLQSGGWTHVHAFYHTRMFPGRCRDGNPNVTAKTTHHVVALSRWMAADLYLREVDILRFEVSGDMTFTNHHEQHIKMLFNQLGTLECICWYNILGSDVI